MMPNREEYLEQVLSNMTKFILACLKTKPCATFDQIAYYFQASESEVHKAVFSLGCAVDEDKWGYLILSGPQYSPREAARRFIEGKEL